MQCVEAAVTAGAARPRHTLGNNPGKELAHKNSLKLKQSDEELKTTTDFTDEMTSNR